MAGPIVTLSERLPQFEDKKNKLINYENMNRGLYIFSIGLAKKFLLIRRKIFLIHYQFMGKQNMMGKKKYKKIWKKSFVVRTSWVFGIANNNFNKQVINWSKNKSELSVVDNQISSPTYLKI